MKMKKSIKEIRADSREIMLGNLLLPVLVTLTYYVLSNIVSFCVSISLIGNGIWALIFYVGLNIVMDTLFSILDLGKANFYLKYSLSKDYSFADLWHGFKGQADKTLLVGFIMALISHICFMPYVLYVNLFVDKLSKMALLKVGVIYVACAFLFFIISVFFTQAYYILCDIPKAGPLQALRLSARLIGRNFWRYIGLQISLIPVRLLGVLSFGIAFLWISPYIETCKALFYSDMVKSR